MFVQEKGKNVSTATSLTTKEQILREHVIFGKKNAKHDLTQSCSTQYRRKFT